VAFGVLLLFGILVERDLMFLLLGIVALGGALLGTRPTKAAALSIDRPAGSALCGLAVTSCNITAGVGGPLLDVFYLASALERRAIVATKAFTQTFAHVTKVGYIALISPKALESQAFAPLLLGASLAAALAGTWLGGRVLERLSEREFRRVTRALVAVVGGVYVARGLLG
jgi:uncharacterized membrane protein YfcA